ncbi:MAG: hypothetical protein PF904_10650 [Kiritimatiellae bacterium]|nr:hypothetical protein [Kiritimatiellia bacterium]
MLLMLFVAGSTSQAETFNVNFDSSREPYLSGPGGTLPAPEGLPEVSWLGASPSDSTHTLNEYSPLWLDSYQSGDYFSFDVTALHPDDKIVLEGIWFGVDRSADGPTSFSVELWSSGAVVESRGTTTAGVFVWGMGVTSTVSSAEIRVVGRGGTDDIGPGPFDTFGLSFASVSFTVVPELLPARFIDVTSYQDEITLALDNITPGREYEVQSCADLHTNAWAFAHSFLGLTSATNVTLTNYASPCFFRVLTRNTGAP